MTDYVVNGPYPAFHYGGHVKGNEYAAFCETRDLINPDARVLLIPGTPVSVLSSTPIIVQPEFFGLHFRRRNNDRVDRVFVKTARTHDMEGGKARWQFLQPTSTTTDWLDLDLWVLAHERAGHDMIFTFFGTPNWAAARKTEENAYSKSGATSNRGIASEPTDMADWDAFCSAVATRYRGRIKYYEVWNEPNIANTGTLPNPTTNCFFTGTWAKLSEMVRRANVAVKTADPAAKILSPCVQGWAATGTDTSGAYFAGMMDAPTGDGSTKMKDWVDVIAVHLYTDDPTANLAASIDRVLAARAAAGLTALEIWDTESGMITTATANLTDAQIIQYLTRFMLTLAAKGISRTIYYQLDNTMGFLDRPNVYAGWNMLREDMLLGNVQYISRLFDGRLVIKTPARGQQIV